jgi:hypothetical protein
MNLEDIFPSRRRKDPLHAIAMQLDQLRRQTRHINSNISHDAADIAGDFGEAVSDWGREAAKQGAWLAGAASRNAMRGADAVRRDPLPVIAILGTAVLIGSLLTRRR